MTMTIPVISIRKTGMRLGSPHYGAECMTCRSVLVVAYKSREYAKAAGERHKAMGCQRARLYCP